MNAIEWLQVISRRFGYDVVPFNAAQHALPRRARLLQYHQIDTVLDVGANAGQFGRELRAMGFGGLIVSFEPLASAFEQLKRAAHGDRAWRVFNVALGDKPGSQQLHRAANSESSSLLGMLPLHVQAAPYATYTGVETVRVETLDGLFDDIASGSRRLLLKIDTQGYESHVLQGAAQSLPRIALLQIEMSLAPLYDGQALFDQLYAQLRQLQFRMVGVESNFGDARTGQLLQFDATFARSPDEAADQ